jgi:hypothetical protein
VSELKVGDKIRILEDGHWCAGVSRGDVLEVDLVDGQNIRVTDYWLFHPSQEGIGWERYEEVGE